MARGAALRSWSAFTSRIVSLFLRRFMSGLISFKSAAEGFFLIFAIKGSLLWVFCSPVKIKKETRKKAILWCAISAVNKRTSDKIANLASSCYTSPDLLPFSKHHPSVTSALISVFIFVTWVWSKWNLRRLLYTTPVQIKNSLFQTDTVTTEGGHWEHLETRCSAVCQHHLSDLTHLRVRLCSLAWTCMCQARQLCTKTHAHT